MANFFSAANKKTLFDITKKTFETLHLKLLVYQITMNFLQTFALNRIKKIVENEKPPEKNPDKKKILLYTVGRYGLMGYVEGAIAKSLQLRGHDVKMLICGKGLSMCTTHFTVSKPYEPWVCKNCVSFTTKFFDILKLPYSTFKDYVIDKDIKIIQEKVSKLSIKECEKLVYKGVNVGFHAIASVERYFMGIIPKKDDYERILRIELINAMISTDVAENILKKEKQDILVTSQGVYSSWGAISDYFKNKKIRTCIWAGGEGPTITFDINKSEEYFKKYYNDIRKKQQLNSDEEKQLDRFLHRRIKGEEGQVAFYDFEETSEEELEQQFNFSKYDKTYVIFPNVPWDADVLTSNIVFKDVYDWIFSTIEIFKKQTKKLLIIKIHPSELKFMESKRTVQDSIKEKYSSLPDNVKIIPADTKISPYSLFPFIDVGIVYMGTVGLEMAVNNIPVIVAAKAHYMGKGFTYDTKTREEYKKALEKDLKPVPGQENLTKIYSYFHFIKKFMPRTFVHHNGFLGVNWSIESIEQFRPGNDKHLDHVCDYIINNGVYQNW